jgi:tol-pal system protein YbgF
MGKYLYVLCAALMMSSAPAYCESEGDKIARLEKQLTLLSKKVYGENGTPAPAPISAPSDAPLVSDANVEQQVQQLLSRIEELEHKNQTLATKVEELSVFAARPAAPAEPEQTPVAKKAPVAAKPKKAIEAPAPVEEAAVAAEGAPVKPHKPKKPAAKAVAPEAAPVAAAPAAQATASATPDPDEIARIHAQATAQEALPQGTVQEQYNHAYGLLKAGHYEEASVALQAFLDHNPDHNLAANATYWLGESYFVRESYDKAVGIFAQGYQTYGKGSKGPDMLLKVALCLEKQNKKPEACAMIDQLREGHKVVPHGIDQGAKTLKQRLKCT